MPVVPGFTTIVSSGTRTITCALAENADQVQKMKIKKRRILLEQQMWDMDNMRKILKETMEGIFRY